MGLTWLSGLLVGQIDPLESAERLVVTTGLGGAAIFAYRMVRREYNDRHDRNQEEIGRLEEKVDRAESEIEMWRTRYYAELDLRRSLGNEAQPAGLEMEGENGGPDRS